MEESSRMCPSPGRPWPPPKKTKTKRARKAKPKVTKPPKQRVGITPKERAQRRRAYEQAGNKFPHRRKQHRVHSKEGYQQAKDLRSFAGPAEAPPYRARPSDGTAPGNAGYTEFRLGRRVPPRTAPARHSKAGLAANPAKLLHFRFQRTVVLFACMTFPRSKQSAPSNLQRQAVGMASWLS